MYGLINKAIQDLVCERFGSEKWEEIKELSNLKDDLFISLKAYPDSLTYSLVHNAARVLGADASVVMETFGEYWVLYTANEGYGEILNFAGDTLPDFLNNLDMLHNHVNHTMPDLRAPQFTTRNQNSNSLDLEYRSSREGLSPMVIGLLRGLGKRFNMEGVEIQQIEYKEDGSECDVFQIKWR
jgi:hypothetical protein